MMKAIIFVSLTLQYFAIKNDCSEAAFKEFAKENEIEISSEAEFRYRYQIYKDNCEKLSKSDENTS